jgi:hypothetical protein
LAVAGSSARGGDLSLGASMTLPARFSLLHSDLNDFLFAAVGVQPNGMPLNVVSALTRLGLDPWDEAARLAALPRALAAETLAPIIARLPIDRPQLSDNLTISRRLVELLPGRQRPASPSRERVSAKDKKYFRVMILLGCVALALAILSSIL